MGYFKTQESVKILGADPVTGIENFYLSINADGSINTSGTSTVTGNVTIVQGGNTAIVDASGNLHVTGSVVTPLPVLTTIIEASKSATTTPAIANVTGTNMVGRDAVFITPLDGVLLHGFTAGTCLIPLSSGNTYEVDASAAVNLYVAAQAGAVTYIVTEGSG